MEEIEIQAQVKPEAPPAPAQEMALMKQPAQGGVLDKPLAMDELKANLDFIREVMSNVMTEGQDYGKVPGCGDKPGLFQPGAQKLLMTFQLTDEVKEEKVTDFPGFHREYSFVVRLWSKTGRFWEGVGTCSTLESKYRFRKAELRCPKCGKHTIIAGKPEFGGGFVCWKKKGGCDAKFSATDPAITAQPRGQVENPNPADNWNTVRKMAFKRALVHAAINATNTSELWSQDLEDLPRDEADFVDHGAPPPAAPAQPPPNPQAAPAPAKTPPPAPNVLSRTKMIGQLMAGPDGPNRAIVTEYFQKLGQLMPNETLEELPLRFVPATSGQMKALAAKIAEFEGGQEAQPAFEPHGVEDLKKEQAPAAPPPPEPAQKQAEAPKQADDWFMKIVVPVPRAGVPKAEYLKAPDTIGSLYEASHTDEEARRRLWGFVNHFEPKPWQGRDGKTRPASETDVNFRKALDAFNEWHEKKQPTD